LKSISHHIIFTVTSTIPSGNIKTLDKFLNILTFTKKKKKKKKRTLLVFSVVAPEIARDRETNKTCSGSDAETFRATPDDYVIPFTYEI
jgi:hypothetical protein